MPKSLPNREAHPAVLETPEIIGEFIQEGYGGQIDFYNLFDDAILIGEPLIYMDRLGISKRVILASEPAQLHFGAIVNFLADPALAAQILAGDKVYFDLDLADDDSTGYATQVEPSNGYFLGHAVMVYEKSAMQLDDTTGKPIACTTAQKRVAVLMHQEKMVWGTNFFGSVPDATNGDALLSS